MNPDVSPQQITSRPDSAEEEITGFPGLRTWGRIYLVVLVVFIIYVVLLTMLSRGFA